MMINETAMAASPPQEQQQQQQQQQKEYILLSATYGESGKKLHWIVAEKQKRGNMFLKNRPADSLCGIHALQVVEHLTEVRGSKPTYDENWSRTNKENKNYFFYYSEDECISDLQKGLDYGYIRRERTRYNPTLEWELQGRKHVGRYERVPVTMELLKSEMWCKQCQKKKAEIYPNL